MKGSSIECVSIGDGRMRCLFFLLFLIERKEKTSLTSLTSLLSSVNSFHSATFNFTYLNRHFLHFVARFDSFFCDLIDVNSFIAFKIERKVSENRQLLCCGSFFFWLIERSFDLNLVKFREKFHPTQSCRFQKSIRFKIEREMSENRQLFD